MQIRSFQNSDISEASRLAKLTWGNFYTHESSELQALIYSFMVEYYNLNREYSFSIIEGGLKGFILAFKKSDKYEGDFTKKVQSLDDKKEQKIASDLFDYLEACGREVKSLMEENDVMLGLFVSIQKGCGKLLLARLNEVCRASGIKSIYLWTDTTCDCDYYQKNNFDLCKEKEVCVNGKVIRMLVYRKKVEFEQ